MESDWHKTVNNVYRYATLSFTVKIFLFLVTISTKYRASYYSKFSLFIYTYLFALYVHSYMKCIGCKIVGPLAQYQSNLMFSLFFFVQKNGEYNNACYRGHDFLCIQNINIHKFFTSFWRTPSSDYFLLTTKEIVSLIILCMYMYKERRKTFEQLACAVVMFPLLHCFKIEKFHDVQIILANSFHILIFSN